MLDASAGGLGGCPFAPGASGNIATEELVYLLEHSGVETGINLDAMLIAAAYAQQTVGNSAGSNLLRAGGPVKPTNPRPDVVLPIAEGGRGHGA
jgi:hydroxymethylglutaryl-CoA lyase